MSRGSAPTRRLCGRPRWRKLDPCGREERRRHHLAWFVGCARELAASCSIERDARVLVGAPQALRLLNLASFRAVRDWTAPRVRAGELRRPRAGGADGSVDGPRPELARHWLADRSRVWLRAKQLRRSPGRFAIALDRRRLTMIAAAPAHVLAMSNHRADRRQAQAAGLSGPPSSNTAISCAGAPTR